MPNNKVVYRIYEEPKWPFCLGIKRNGVLMFRFDRWYYSTADTLAQTRKNPDNIEQMELLREMVDKANGH